MNHLNIEAYWSRYSAIESLSAHMRRPLWIQSSLRFYIYVGWWIGNHCCLQETYASRRWYDR